jgi:hypothetical protein
MGKGRNDPCPCGSGKKYKKCCMLKNVTTPDELHYRRLSEAWGKLFDRLIRHGESVFGSKALVAAMDEYWLWPGEDEEPDDDAFERQMPLFWPWFLLNWEYDPTDDEFELDGPPECTIAELYAQDRGPRLDPLERSLIEAANRTPYSFYEACSVEPGKRIHLRDIFTGNEITVQERSASRHIESADIVFGRVIAVDGVGMIVGMSPYVMPHGLKAELIELRRKIRGERAAVTDEVLNEWDTLIRELYLDIDHSLYAPPEISNTDGDPLEFHKVVYDIDSAETAFEKLASLCVTETADKLRKTAETDADGRIRQAEITWDRLGHKASQGMSNTILGRIVIDGRRLTAEVNSAHRAETIRDEIEARLGTGARFRLDEIRDLSVMMEAETHGDSSATHTAEHDALMQKPEVRRQLAEMLQKHWEGWVDMELPALGGTTPRKAINTAEGREAVEALLLHLERTQKTDEDMGAMNLEGIRQTRELLGLKTPSSAGE